MHWWSSDVFFVTTLQGWVYKTQPTRERCMRRLRAIRRFVCSNILQGWAYKTQPTRERCMMRMRATRRFLCNNIARMGLQNTTKTQDALMHWWSSDVFFVTILQGWVYKTQPTRERCMRRMRAIRRFVCNNLARMGLQNTTNTWEMHDAHASNQTFCL
jgi:hypothetical protein